MNSLIDLLKILSDSETEYIVVGGLAAVLHGASQVTFDLDVCVCVTTKAVENLRQCLAPYNPRHRQTQKKPSFLTTPEDVRGIKNLYLVTELGILDIMSEITGVGPYEKMAKNAVAMDLYGRKIKVISLDDLIKSKEAMGRPKDVATVLELRAIREKQKMSQAICPFSISSASKPKNLKKPRRSARSP